jgi:hypothetical protein
MRAAWTALSIQDTSEEIRVHEPEGGPTLIHTQPTKDHFGRGFVMPIEPEGESINWDAAPRALPSRTAPRWVEYPAAA